MGLSDREYYRQPESPGFTLRRPQSVVTTLLLINVVIFIVDYLFFELQHPRSSIHKLQGQLLVTPDVLTKPWLWWKFVSYGFAHGSVEHLLFNMFGLWMFGREIEFRLGRQEFLRFYLVAMALGSLVWVITEYVRLGYAESPPEGGGGAGLLGASGGVTAVIIAYCVLYPKRTLLLMMVFPVPAWLVGVLLVALNIIQVPVPGEGARIAYDVHLVGAAFGFFYCKLGWNLGRLTPASFSWDGMLKKLKPRPKLRVHAPVQQYQEQDAEADEVLDKLHREGADNLTEQEQRVLEEYSRRMRRKHS